MVSPNESRNPSEDRSSDSASQNPASQKPVQETQVRDTSQEVPEQDTVENRASESEHDTMIEPKKGRLPAAPRVTMKFWELSFTVSSGSKNSLLLTGDDGSGAGVQRGKALLDMISSKPDASYKMPSEVRKDINLRLAVRDPDGALVREVEVKQVQLQKLGGAVTLVGLDGETLQHSKLARFVNIPVPPSSLNAPLVVSPETTAAVESFLKIQCARISKEMDQNGQTVEGYRVRQRALSDYKLLQELDPKLELGRGRREATIDAAQIISEVQVILGSKSHRFKAKLKTFFQKNIKTGFLAPKTHKIVQQFLTELANRT